LLDHTLALAGLLLIFLGLLMLLLVSLFLVHVALVLASFEVRRVQSHRRVKNG